MKKIMTVMMMAFFLSVADLHAQVIRLDKANLEPVQVFMFMEKIMDKNAVRVVKDSNIKKFDEPTFVKIKGLDFKNGIIEVKVLSRLLKNAPEFARGFIGVAFHIDDTNSKFESIYLRPVNATVEDQVRRNHSIQYYSYPDYKFDRLRKEAPEKYESYAAMEMNKWITIRIEVKDAQAKLFLGNNKHPSLIVNDLKHGSNASGGIGLWVEEGTEGFFTDLKIRKY